VSDLTAVSAFGGIGGFDRALGLCGVNVVAAVEIDQECRGVLARQFPGTQLFSDITEVTGEQLRAAGFAPRRGILAGGWPCQDLSIAGRRAGLGGARSGLFWQVVRLADELLPQWLVLENVPGLLSAVCPCAGDEACIDNGRAVACGRWEKRDGKRIWLDHVIHTPPGGGCCGGCMEQHGGAMGSVIGALEGLGYGLCWRVLDSRFFHVPQRRERVFIVGCLGDGAAPVEVLLEPEGGTGNPAPRGASRQDIAGTLGSRAGGSRTTDLDGHGAYIPSVGTLGGNGPGGGWRVGADEAAAGQLVPVATLQGGGRRGHRIDAEGAAGGHLIPFDTTPNQKGQVHVADTAYALTARNDRNDREENYVTVPVASRGRRGGSQIECSEPGDPAFALRTPGGGSSYPMIAHALTSEGADGEGVRVSCRGREDDENLVPMAFNPQTGGSKAMLGYGETPTALQASQVTGVQSGTAVRRLTPKECERLQNFPDEWTRWKLVNGKLIELSDSARYRVIGNAVTVSVVEWIVRRLVAVDERGEPA